MPECADLILDATAAARRFADGADRRDDLVQETLLRLWSRRKRIAPGPTSPLVRSTLNRIRIDWWRKDRRIRRLDDTDGAVSGDDPLDDASLVELRLAIRSAMDDLPPEQAEVVRLRVDAGKPFAEIAAIQGVPLNTALGRMHLALRRLRRALEEYVEEYVDDPR